MASMREVHDVRVPVSALAGRLGCPDTVGWFRFLLRRIQLKEIALEGNELVHSSFLPVEQLLRETIDELEASGGRAEPCRRCGEYFDVEHDPGIFEDPSELTGFLCRACAEGLSAWDYFHDHLKS